MRHAPPAVLWDDPWLAARPSALTRELNVAMVEVFDSLTEFSVALAGFSGVAIAIKSRDGMIDSLTEFRTRNLLTFALAAAFGSILPAQLSTFALEGTDVWAWSSGIFSLILLGVLGSAVQATRLVDGAERAALSSLFGAFFYAGNSISFVSQILNGFGLFWNPSPAPLSMGIVFLLVCTTVQFLRFLTGASSSHAA